MGTRFNAALALGLALEAGCGGDEPQKEETPAKENAPHRGETLVQEKVPDLSVKDERAAVIKALTPLPQPLTPELELRLSTEAAIGWALTDTLNVQYSPTSVSNHGTKVLGFVVDPVTVAVTPEFFEPHQTDARQATAIETLGLCAEAGTCEVYNGPTTPEIPSVLQAKAKMFLATAEHAENDTITKSGQVFEGTAEHGRYTGTVKYPNGAVATGVFQKQSGSTEFFPQGKFKVVFPDKATLESELDWDATTTEDATITDVDGTITQLKGKEGSVGLIWTYDEEPTDTKILEYSLDWKTMELKRDEVTANPPGVEMHKITDAELAAYTGYGRYTDYKAPSPYSGYEGYWESGAFSGGKGTLRLKNGQTVQGDFQGGKPVATKNLRFKGTSGAAFEELEALPDQSGWLKWIDIKEGNWDKYTWDASATKLVATHMVKP